MHSFLKASDYPDKLCIRNDVFIKEGDINYRNRLTGKMFDVGWVTTFGPEHGEVKKLVSRINRTLVTLQRYGPGLLVKPLLPHKIQKNNAKTRDRTGQSRQLVYT